MKKLFCTILILTAFVFTASSAYAVPGITETIFTDWEFESGLIYGFNGDGHTYDYASYINFTDCNTNLPDWASGTSIGTASYLPNSLAYGHNLPDGLLVPPDQIISAKLFVDAWLVGTENNLIQIESPILTWDPLNDWSFLGMGDNSLYDLTDVDLPGFWNNSPLDITITAQERRIRIDRSILMIDYESAPVPEPATLLMLGIGLLGAGFVIRKKNVR